MKRPKNKPSKRKAKVSPAQAASRRNAKSSRRRRRPRRGADSLKLESYEENPPQITYDEERK